jgi:large subunit ribosomal protein L7/L12
VLLAGSEARQLGENARLWLFHVAADSVRRNRPSARRATQEEGFVVMADLNAIVDSLSSLTVMEAAELASLLEEKWGVSAAAPVAIAAGGGVAPGEAAVEEKDEFDVILISQGDKKIQVIKEVRAITSLGLKEAEDRVEGAPKPIKEAVSKDEAEKIKEQIESAGGQVDIK